MCSGHGGNPIVMYGKNTFGFVKRKHLVEKKYKLYLILFIIIQVSSQLHAQEESRSLRLGINYGTGTQQFFPFHSPDYSYDVRGYKVVINSRLKIKKARAFRYELQLEPGIYSAKHQLLNKYFIQPKDGADYLQQRERFTKEKTITEYALNVGMLVRYTPKEKFSFFVLGSIGPMISDTGTERLAKGFAFSDIIALGVAYKAGKIMFEIRPGLRHVSNANLQLPNSGHNSSNIDFGISVSI